MAAYTNHQFKWNDQFTLQTGLRYNITLLNAIFDTSFYPIPFTTTQINKGALSGSLGAVWRPSDTWVIRMNLGTGFRSPNVDDLGKVFDSEPGAVTVPNPDLRAEYVYNVDFGVAKVIGDIARIDVVAFYSLLDNAMVRRDYTLNGEESILYFGEESRVQAIQNAAVANVYGLQASIELRLSKKWMFMSDINYQKGEEELDDGSKSPSRHAAPFFGSGRINYRNNRLQLSLFMDFQAERNYEGLAQEERAKDEIYAKDEEGRNYSPRWYDLSLKARYQLNDHLWLNAGLENITDQRYRSYSSGVSAPGRNVVISLKAGF